MKRIITPFVISILLLFLFSCTSDSNVEGEIVGVTAKTSLSDVQSGTLEDMAYGGSLSVLLSDSTIVEARCTEDLLSIVKGCPKFNKNPEEIHGPLFANINVKLEQGQKTIVFSDTADNWNVKEILE